MAESVLLAEAGAISLMGPIFVAVTINPSCYAQSDLKSCLALTGAEDAD